MSTKTITTAAQNLLRDADYNIKLVTVSILRATNKLMFGIELRKDHAQ